MYNFCFIWIDIDQCVYINMNDNFLMIVHKQSVPIHIDPWWNLVNVPSENVLNLHTKLDMNKFETVF